MSFFPSSVYQFKVRRYCTSSPQGHKEGLLSVQDSLHYFGKGDRNWATFSNFYLFSIFNPKCLEHCLTQNKWSINVSEWIDAL